MKDKKSVPPPLWGRPVAALLWRQQLHTDAVAALSRHSRTATLRQHGGAGFAAEGGPGGRRAAILLSRLWRDNKNESPPLIQSPRAIECVAAILAAGRRHRRQQQVAAICRRRRRLLQLCCRHTPPS